MHTNPMDTKLINTKVKIQIVNNVLSALCMGLIIALPVLNLLFWLNFEEAVQSLNLSLGGKLQIDTIQTWQIASAGLFSVFTSLILVVGLWHLRLLFENFKHAEFFSEKNTHYLYVVSKILFLSAVLKCVNTAVLSVLLTWNNGPNQKSLVVAFGSNELWMIIAAATFLTIAWTFKEGQTLAKENAEFI